MIHSDLNQGFENWIERDPKQQDRLDGLLESLWNFAKKDYQLFQSLNPHIVSLEYWQMPKKIW